MLTVRDIMNPAVVTVAPDTTVRQLARLLADEEISGAPVVDQSGRLQGVVSATDVVRLAAADADVRLASATFSTERPQVRDPDEDEEPDPDPFGFFLQDVLLCRQRFCHLSYNPLCAKPTKACKKDQQNQIDPEKT